MKVVVAALAIIILFVVVITTHSQNEIPKNSSIIVNIPGLGAIIGNNAKTTWTNQTFMEFKGIPYAESPKGARRFKPPIARLPWRQILDATKYGRRCPVITTVSNLSATELKRDLEDCLNLSIFSKKLDAQQPVMFYIYGGGFYNGTSADFPPNHLLEKDIVLVVVNYRVGALGWLSSFTNEMPGNVAIMDVILALQWVQSHIKAFGGDPSQITVFGQSAGAAITGGLLVSPHTSRGYFKRAIMQSGSIFAHWAINQNPLAQVKRICDALKCNQCNTNEARQICLQSVPVLDLLKVTTNETFAPVVGDLNNVLPHHPKVLLNELRATVPIMTGFTRDDGSFILGTYYDGMKNVHKNLSQVTVRQFANGIMDLEDDKTRLTNNVLMRLLFRNEELNGSDHKKAIPAYLDLTSIQFMKSPVIATTSYFLKRHISNVYLYNFDYEGEQTYFGYGLDTSHYPFNGGVHHSNDNIYIFAQYALNENDTKVAKKVVELWTSFAITGVPSAGANGPKILAMQDESGPFFHINKDIKIGHDILKELTRTVDDPNNNKLVRENVEF